jgi:glycosyltransferase involved in cell wall biosynthesis
MIEILHLSHTNITSDKRIAKELNVIAKINCGKYIRAVGLEHNKIFKDISNQIDSDINVVNINSRLFLFISKLPRILRLIIFGPILIYIEMMVLFYKAVSDRRWSIIHCHDALLLPLATFLSIRYNSKLIYDAHELESETNGISMLEKAYVLIIEKLSWERIHAVITVSNAICEWYRNKYGSKIIEVIMNSPDYTYCKVSIGKIRNKSISYVYVGLMTRGRGIDGLLQYFTLNTTSTLTFIGDGELFDEIEQHSKLCKNIKILKPMKHDDMMIELLKYDVGVCIIPECTSLSDYFSLPNKVFEYMFAGLHIISTDLPEIRKLLYDNKCGNVIEGNDFSGIHISEDVYSKFRYLGAIENLGWTSQGKKLTNLYLDIINYKDRSVNE